MVVVQARVASPNRILSSSRPPASNREPSATSRRCPVPGASLSAPAPRDLLTSLPRRRAACAAVLLSYPTQHARRSLAAALKKTASRPFLFRLDAAARSLVRRHGPRAATHSASSQANKSSRGGARGRGTRTADGHLGLLPMMAALPPRWRPLLLLLVALLHVLLIGGAAAPFRARDVLPLLPRRLAWQLMGATAHSAVDLLPSFVAAVAPGGPAAAWRGACFEENQAVLSLTTPGSSGGRNGTAAGGLNSTTSGLGGAVIHLKTASPQSWTCMDLYVFATPYRIAWDYYMRSNENHTFEIKAWEEAAELEYVKQHGIAVFLMPSGMLGTLLSLVDVVPLFSNTGWGQDANLAFLQKHMGTSFQKRSAPWSANIRREDVHSGDFLALSKIRGRWGGFQTLEKWVTGAFAGHTAVFLKDENGTLWVAESGYENKKGDEIISMTPWDEWWGMALKDDSNPQIALLPLHPDVRARFNESAAWEFARSMYGKPYGYHNMIFSWIDTMSDNYPPPLDANLVMAIMSMWTRLQPHYASNMWNEALNKRLGTEKLDLHGVISETEKRGLSFNQLLTIPERDDWEYSDGKSTTCVAFILSMYKAAGVFAPFTESIQVTEFTIRDAYMLKIFEDNQTRLPSWCNAAADRLPFCQILGEYKMDLPEYNTIEPYANMNENCPSAPPTYNRPSRC